MTAATEEMEELMKLDLYTIIGGTIESSMKELKSGYRKKSRELHPDKNKAKNAAEMFDRLHKVYAFLTDAEKRKKFDAKLHAKAKREALLAAENADRRSARQALERREKAAEQKMSFKRQKTEEEVAHRATQSMLNSLREQGAFHVPMMPTKTAERKHTPVVPKTETRNEMETAISVKWSKKMKDSEQGIRNQLQRLFSVYGQIRNIVMRCSQRKAFIMFSSREEAEIAVSTHPPDHAVFRKIVLVVKTCSNVRPAPPSVQPNTTEVHRQPAARPASNISSDQSQSDYERLTLMRMKAMAKKRKKASS